VHPADFFEDDVDAAMEIHGGARSVSVLNVELLDRLCVGPLPDETDLSAAEGLFDLVEHELIAYGTADLSSFKASSPPVNTRASTTSLDCGSDSATPQAPPSKSTGCTSPSRLSPTPTT
jgi:hypothetical protein